MRRDWIALAFLVPLVAACSGRDDPGSSDGTWVGTITTEGDVTTVVNESGSVWGGAARLVEELSIGVDEGAPEYMLGPARTVWDSGDRILVPDMSVPIVRAYDGSGNYLGDIGAEGQGPGEYTYPFAVVQLEDDRIFVTDSRSECVDVFAGDFTYVERWGPFPEDMSAPGARLIYTLALDEENRLWMRYWEIDPDLPEDSDNRRQGWRTISPDGLGPPLWRPAVERVEMRSCMRPDCMLYLSVPFAPFPSFALSPWGDVIAGAGDEYVFEIHHGDGSRTMVRRTIDPVEIGAEERDYWRRRQRAEGLLRNPDWQESWGDVVPTRKPAFNLLYVNSDGNILAVREGPGVRVSDCTEDPRPDDDFIPCWQSTPLWDYFAPDGRYLGAIEPPPERLRWIPHLNGSRFTMMVEDESGTIMAKRYRLVLPGEEGY